jgi:hypothetical protein
MKPEGTMEAQVVELAAVASTVMEMEMVMDTHHY